MKIVLVGNKDDISSSQRSVSSEEGARFGREHGISHFFECSAKSANLVDKIFLTLSETILGGEMNCDGLVLSFSSFFPPSVSWEKYDTVTTLKLVDLKLKNLVDDIRFLPHLKVLDLSSNLFLVPPLRCQKLTLSVYF